MKFCYQGERDNVVRSYMSLVRTERLIRRGCDVYLAFVLTEPEESKLRVGDVPVVQEFPNVFPEELPGVPPE